MLHPVLLDPSGEKYDRSYITRSLRIRDIDPHTNVALNGDHRLVAMNWLPRDIRDWVEPQLRETSNVHQALRQILMPSRFMSSPSVVVLLCLNQGLLICVDVPPACESVSYVEMVV